MHYTDLKVNQNRIADAIHSGCQWGQNNRYGQGPNETGMGRLALNDDDRQVRKWFIEQAEAVGCKISVDKMGNIFAIRPGKFPNAPPTVAGSHLDTQPAGGRYDGILGVNAGLEMLRVLHENNYETNGSVGVVNWTNEEGARFPMMMVASGVWAESIPLATGWSLKEISNEDGGEKLDMKQELERIGFLGDMDCSYKSNPLAAHFELHIAPRYKEQGPILETESRKIGVVDGVQAFKWFEIKVTGRGAHTGTTPLNTRSDALLCAARLIVQSNSIAKRHGGLASTGVLGLTPGSINTFPGSVTFTLDIRHPSDKTLEGMESDCRTEFAKIAKKESERGCTLDWKLLTPSPAVNFHPDCISAVERSAIDVCGDKPGMKEGKLWKHITSGAGHDSCYTSKRIPTSMIFVPCKGGISHNPEEYCTPEDCAIGAQVLLGAVLRYDEWRVQKGDFEISKV